MKKTLLWGGLSALLSLCVQAENLFPRPSWKLTPDAEKLLAEYAQEGKIYRPATGRTLLFPRAQLKYTLDRSDYLHRWYDRPLLQNTALARFNKRGVLVNPECAKLLKHTAIDLGSLDGVAFFPGTSGRESFFRSSEDIQLPILPELIVSPAAAAGKAEKHAAMAVRSANAYRVGGKALLTVYPFLEQPEQIRSLRAKLDKKCAGKYLLVPYADFMPHALAPQQGKPTDAAHLRATVEYLRKILREADGFCIRGNPLIWDRRVQPEYGFKVVLPVLHKIFSEPEFQNKLLVFHWPQGHENSYRWSYGIDSEGTATLRKHGDFFLKLRPALCILPEWDEENENTGFRPTADTGFSAMRLMRYYASQFRNEKPTPFPGDDLKVPNLILSYRKQLLAGETAEFQLTNVPDGAKRLYRASLTLTDLNGKVIRKFAPQEFSSGKCDSVSFKAPAAELLPYQSVSPQLEVTWEGGSFRASGGFWPLELRANWVAEWRWVKQPLRELISGVKAELSAEKTAEGLVRVQGKFSSQKPVAQLELLEGIDTVWMADSRPALRETKDQVVIDVSAQSYWPRPVSGSLSVLNAPSAATGTGEKLPVLLEKKSRLSSWTSSRLVVLSRADAEKAVLKVDYAPVFHVEIPVKEILAKNTVGFNGPAGETLVFRRYSSQRAIPEHGKITECSIDCLVRPGDEKSLFSLRAIDEKGNIWRGAALSLRKAAGKELSFPVYDRETRKSLTVKADASLVTCHEFDFAPGRGAVVPNRAGWKYSGFLNGFLPRVTGFGTGESGYGSLAHVYLKKNMKSLPVPKRIREPEGFWSMEFGGGAHISLPLQLVPLYSGFRMSMKICVPKIFKQDQTIWTSGPNGCSLWVRKGKLRATCFSDQNFFATGVGSLFASCPVPLEPGKWHTVTFERNGKEFWLSVDGIKGKSVPFCGSILRHNSGILGMGMGLQSAFQGKIADFSVTTGE